MRLLVLLCFTGLLLAAETRAQSPRTHEITVSAAISLKNAFEDIGTTFMEKYPGTKVVFNFGASGDLARQIEAGAPVDVFASAAQKDMDDIAKKDLIDRYERFETDAIKAIEKAYQKHFGHQPRKRGGR